jgi:acid phosphatase (class A)
MRLRQLSALLVAFGFLVFTHAYAGETKYLAANTPDVIALLPAPPSADSLENQTELDTTYRVYSACPPEQLARSKDENKLTLFHFAPAIGPWFQPGKFPKTEALFNEVELEAKIVINLGKEHWQRARPYNADPARFTNAVEHEGKTSYSYPSGHSTRGTVFTLLLAEIFPEKRSQLIEAGRDCGWLRVQGGVHYPNDVFAGRVLGQALAQALLKSPAFQQDLAEVKAELATATR